MGAVPPFRRRPRCWLVLSDPCGYVCVVFTHIIAWGTAALVNVYILLPRLRGILSFLHAVFYNYTILALIVAHVRCMCTNPGTARDHLDEELLTVMRREYQRAPVPRVAMRRKWWCVKCDTFRPKHTHHCSTCRACILEMDHHCPWVNNCVGWRNHKYFLLFLLYAWVGCLWSMGLFIVALTSSPEPTWRLASEVFLEEFGDAGSEAPGRTIRRTLAARSDWRSRLEARVGSLHRCFPAQFACILSCVVCFLMLIFVSIMACDQGEYMSQGYGIIDQKQLAKEQSPPVAPAPPKGSRKSCATRCCGDKLPLVMGMSKPWGLRWLLPVTPGVMSLAEVPEDEMICDARRRYYEEQDGPEQNGSEQDEPERQAPNCCANSATRPLAAPLPTHNGGPQRAVSPDTPQWPRARKVAGHADEAMPDQLAADDAVDTVWGAAAGASDSDDSGYSDDDWGW